MYLGGTLLRRHSNHSTERRRLGKSRFSAVRQTSREKLRSKNGRLIGGALPVDRAAAEDGSAVIERRAGNDFAMAAPLPFDWLEQAPHGGLRAVYGPSSSNKSAAKLPLRIA